MFKFAGDQGHLIYFRSVRGRFNVGSGQAPIPGPRALAGWQYSVECICVREYVCPPSEAVSGWSDHFPTRKLFLVGYLAIF